MWRYDGLWQGYLHDLSPNIDASNEDHLKKTGTRNAWNSKVVDMDMGEIMKYLLE